MSKPDKKKEKITYIDDGRTVADMSGLPQRRFFFQSSKSSYRPYSTLREKLTTFWEAMKLMFLPMLIVMGFIAVAFLLVYVIL